MKIKKTTLVLLLSLIFSNVFSQGKDETIIQFNYTNKLAYSENFTGAIRMYKQMISFDPQNPVFYYKLGFAYLNTINKADSAVINLKKSNLLYSDKYRAEVSIWDIKFYLARAYRLNKNIDSSLMILEKLRQDSHNKQFIENINNELLITRQSIDNLFTIEDLDSVVNSIFSEHSPVYSAKNNILIFTSRKYNSNSQKLDDGQYDEDIYYSDWKNGAWSSPKLMKQFSTRNNEATMSIINQGDFLLIYKDEQNGSIFSSEFKNGKWTIPKMLPKPINSKFRETHASMTPDGKQIIFTSDRPGGYGGLDIWTSFLQDDGSWSKPVNLGDAINTPEDEESPNLSDDGDMLYFSSNGRKGYGGFDIFKSQRTDFNTWTIAQNLKYPINSVGDDIFFTQIANTEKAFYSSYRYGSKGNADIFIVYLDSAEAKIKTINYGYIFDKDKKPITSANIEIINHKTGELSIYKPSDSGKFIFITKAKITYTLKIILKNTIIYSETFSTSDTVPEKKYYKEIIIPDNNF